MFVTFVELTLSLLRATIVGLHKMPRISYDNKLILELLHIKFSGNIDIFYRQFFISINIVKATRIVRRKRSFLVKSAVARGLSGESRNDFFLAR